MRNCARQVVLSSVGCGMKDVKRIIGRKRDIQVSVYFNLVAFLLSTFEPFTPLRPPPPPPPVIRVDSP